MRTARQFLLTASAALTIVLTACDYDTPITENPTRRADSRLLALWRPVAAGRADETLRIQRFDDMHYVVLYDGDLFLVHHSDAAGLSFVSVRSCGKYAYFAWDLSEDGKRLTIREVDKDVIPSGTSDVIKLLEMNRNNPHLFEEAFTYARD